MDRINEVSETRRPSRSYRALCAAIVVLSVVVLATAWHSYSGISTHDTRLFELSGVKQSLAAVGARAQEAEARLSEWTGGWNGLVDRVTKLEDKLSAGLRFARGHASELVRAVEERVSMKLEGRTRPVEARMARLESEQEKGRRRLADLETEISAAQNQLAGLRRDAVRDVAILPRGIEQNQSALSNVESQNLQQRVDFEAGVNQTTKLTDAISLRLTRTSPSYQRFSGWLWLAPDRRTVWVRDQGAQQPVIFYSKNGGQRYELVVNGVTKNSVNGYLLAPFVGVPMGALAPPAAGGASSTPAGFPGSLDLRGESMR